LTPWPCPYPPLCELSSLLFFIFFSQYIRSHYAYYIFCLTYLNLKSKSYLDYFLFYGYVFIYRGHIYSLNCKTLLTPWEGEYRLMSSGGKYEEKRGKIKTGYTFRKKEK
jgi:hypothetical protein